MRCTLLLVLTCAFAAIATAGAQTIFLVRHAERADAGGVAQTDPGLSKEGHERAAALARTLQDAKIVAIYATEYSRTQETAQPLAEKIGVRATIIPAKGIIALIAKLKNLTGNVLIVGHSNTLPEIVKALGVSSPITIGELEYDNLLVVVGDPLPRILQLHYR
ncbi:MAG: histidine phosphatase family protein [Chthoniobacterales bacterium]|nr:histidine phosphatase family protein [Chthoniobacterales bacterium]